MNDILDARSERTLPTPRRRLWRTLFRRKRDLTPFAPPLSFDALAGALPTMDEAAHWGEVILVEDHTSVLHRDGTTSYGVHYISMLHGDMNIAPWEQVVWYYQTQFWRPTVHHALLRSEDGWTQPAGVFDRMIDANSKLRMMQVSFGPMKRGVIVDIAHQTDGFQPAPWGPSTYGQFFLQTGPPCRHRRFTVAIAAPFQAEVRRHYGAAAPREFDVADYKVWQWDLRNVPGIEWDAWTPPLRDFGPWIDFTTLPSWDPVAQQYRKDICPTHSAEVRSLARKLTAEKRTDRDKLAAIYRYAAEQVRYGRPPHELYQAASRPASKVFEDLRGDCKDKSTLMVSMLRALDMDAEIALVETRSTGVAPFLPAPRFNHALVVARLDNEMVWLDAAGGLFTFGEVPYQDQGIRALILSEDSCDYIEAPAPKPADHGVEWRCTGTLDDSGEYHFKLRFHAHGERASMLRIMCEHRNREFRDRLLRQTLMRGVPGAEVTDLEVKAINDLSARLECDAKVRLTGCGRWLGRMLLVHVPWAEPTIFDGPSAASDRPQPLAPPLVQEIRERHELALPADLTGYALPHLTRHECPWASYENSARIEENTLICERRLTFLGGIVPPQRYAEFRDFWAACARADADAVVLMRRGG